MLQGFELPDGDFDFREDDKDKPASAKPEEKAEGDQNASG